MLNFMTVALDTGAGTSVVSGFLTSTTGSFVLIAVMLLFMWLVLIRPQKKKEKQQRDMRSSLEVGDGVTTIGGIVGRVVSIKDDTILIETGSDRTKMRFQKWAIQDVEKLKLDE